MLKDVAQRQFDLAGFRISRLGAPVEAGDATQTDHAHPPLAPARDGAAGASFFAAAADHVHPLQPDLLELSDPSLQIVSTRTEIWHGVIDFDQLVGNRIQIGLSAMLQSCLLMAWLDGEVGAPTTGTLVMNIDSDAAELVPIASVSSGPFVRPAGAHLLTLTAEPLSPAPEGRTLGRVVSLRGKP